MSSSSSLFAISGTAATVVAAARLINEIHPPMVEALALVILL
jgi:hypothetical protein